MTARDIVMSAAGNSGDSKTYIEDVFSTYLYTGNGATQTINNGIDLAGKGGMVWIKCRSNPTYNTIFDTERGFPNLLKSEDTAGQVNATNEIGSATSTGFTVPANTVYGYTNWSTRSYASWTFRKAPKFFDVVTWTGDGSDSRQIPHNLGVAPGMIVTKPTNRDYPWRVYHRGANGGDSYAYLNDTSPFSNGNGNLAWGNMGAFIAPSDSSFTVTSNVNQGGYTYVAYLFAHDTTTDGLIQCGSFTTDANGFANANLGWEPQYVLVKPSSGYGGWVILDTMRGFSMASDQYLYSNTSQAESTAGWGNPTAIGFDFTDASNRSYIYMAIRRGPMRTPTDGTKVFSPIAYTGTGSSGRSLSTLDAIDTSWIKWRSGNPYGDSWSWSDRIRGIAQLASPSTSAESTWTDHLSQWGPNQNTVLLGNGGTVNGSSMTYIQYAFRRAPGFFDVVCYTGTGSSTTVKHNLGSIPELMIVKSRSASGPWTVFENIGPSGFNRSYLHNSTQGYDFSYGVTAGLAAQPTSTQFVLDNTNMIASGTSYVAYLFASCPGVSKVGSYTGNGSSQTINCGFTNGARFVLIKCTSNTGNWVVMDTARGITTGNDPWLVLNATVAEYTSDDILYPNSSGFSINTSFSQVNTVGETYIYLAIA